jgi:hypothetical protein
MPTTTPTILDQISAEKTKVSERLARLDTERATVRHSVHRSRDGRVVCEGPRQAYEIDDFTFSARSAAIRPTAVYSYEEGLAVPAPPLTPVPLHPDPMPVTFGLNGHDPCMAMGPTMTICPRTTRAARLRAKSLRGGPRGQSDIRASSGNVARMVAVSLMPASSNLSCSQMIVTR